jgi:hypothetical protein
VLIIFLIRIYSLYRRGFIVTIPVTLLPSSLLLNPLSAPLKAIKSFLSSVFYRYMRSVYHTP